MCSSDLKLIVWEGKAVVKRIIELNQSVEEPFVDIRLENAEQMSIPFSKVIWADQHFC